MATPTKRRTPAKKTKTAETPAAEPTSAVTGAPARTDVSGGEGTEGPAAGSARTGSAPARDGMRADARGRNGGRDDGDLQEAIARRAYEIYEAKGRPEGRETEHWAEAERQVLAERAGR